MKATARRAALTLLLGGIGLVVLSHARASNEMRLMPPPMIDLQGATGPQNAIFAGGCFWGVQGVFEHVRGVTRAVSGYTGGHTRDPDYEQVSYGASGHAEAVRVTFDPQQISYGKLLQIFFSVALDPTQLNSQGPDTGPQYRSELFVQGPGQTQTAQAYLAQLSAAHLFPAPIVTRIDPATPFYPAESYHQDYLTRHPDNPYIATNDLPKIEALRRLFPGQFRAEPVDTGAIEPAAARPLP